jgi:uncharacterized protein with FMN-binding domain
MRRALIVLTATVTGLAAVLSFDAHEPARPTLSTTAGAAAPPAGSTTPSTSTSGAKTATGDAIDTRYGAAQVRVTVSGGKITAVEAIQLQGVDPKSVRISSSAEPLLRQSALTKQSASVDMVSGATYTSESYAASLQSALDKLGFKAANGG